MDKSLVRRLKETALSWRKGSRKGLLEFGLFKIFAKYLGKGTNSKMAKNADDILVNSEYYK